MYMGHFALGIAAKPAAPKVSLGTLLVAPQVLDILHALFERRKEKSWSRCLRCAMHPRPIVPV
jgi:hypothetical protein